MELKYSILAMVLLSGISLGLIISPQLSKESYSPGETITLTLSANNPGAQAKDYSLICSFVPVGEEYGVYPMLEEFSLGPSASKPFSFSMEVTPTMPSGEWVAKLILLEGTPFDGWEVDAKNISFQIAGTLEPIDIAVFSCKDSLCADPSDVFYMNETVYLRYNSSVSALSVSGELPIPGGSDEILSLPSDYSPEKTGTHILTVTASKAGYQTAVAQLRFGILEAPVQIQTKNITYLPGEQLPPEKESDNETAVSGKAGQDQTFLFITAAVILGIVVLAVILKRK